MLQAAELALNRVNEPRDHVLVLNRGLGLTLCPTFDVDAALSDALLIKLDKVHLLHDFHLLKAFRLDRLGLLRFLEDFLRRLSFEFR